MDGLISGERLDPVLAWHRRTLVEAYAQVGRRSDKWNAPAAGALEAFAILSTHRDHSDPVIERRIATNANAAVQAGCNDALIEFLQTAGTFWRGGYAPPDGNIKAFAERLKTIARAMEKTPYHPMRKCQTQLEAIAWTRRYLSSARVIVVQENFYSDLQGLELWARRNLELALTDRTMPLQEVDDACTDMLDMVWHHPEAREECMAFLERVTKAAGTHSPAIPIYKARMHLSQARSLVSRPPKNTQPDMVAVLQTAHYESAKKLLEDAWRVNAADIRVAVNMIDVEGLPGGNRQQMELWFLRAMSLDTNSYAAAKAKLAYLDPRRQGSAEEMLIFARECAQSRKWGPELSLILGDAHMILSTLEPESERSRYWLQSHVWPDIRLAFDRYVTQYPDRLHQRHLYVRYAAWCAQWGEVRRLLEMYGGRLDPEFFGGQKAFAEIVSLATRGG